MLVVFVVAWPVGLWAFYSTVSFLSAVTSEQAIARYHHPLPDGWTAGVNSHGEYYQWWTIQEKPILFAVSASALTGALLVMWGTLYWRWKQNRLAKRRMSVAFDRPELRP